MGNPHLVRDTVHLDSAAEGLLRAHRQMSGADFLRLAKLKGSGKVSLAARHNRRDIQAELGAAGHIDPTRSHLNETLAGPPTARDVANLAKDLMRAAGIERPRKDAVLAVEILFSLPVDHAVNEKQFFSDCLAWAAQRFGGAGNILSADVHRDEAAPHCHMLILPLINGRLVGSDLVGNRAALREHRQSFYSAVSARHGLARAPARLSGSSKHAAATQVLESLRTGPDGALRSRLWPQIRASIEQDPGPYLSALGLAPKPRSKRMRKMAQIFTSPGRGPKREREKPIGFESPERHGTLSCVGFADPSLCTATQERAKPPTRTPKTGNEDGLTVGFERQREDELDVTLFDPESGEFRAPTAKSEHWLQATWFDPLDS